MFSSPRLCLAAALALVTPAPAFAQDTNSPVLMLELNAATPTENQGCRLTMVTTSRLEQTLERAAWQVAIFDSNGMVQALPILDFGTLLGGKTKVAMFELPGTDCTAIGRIVVNDVAECRAQDGTDLRGQCLTGLETQSRSDIDFGL
ncbi:MAG: hypothetical protein Q4G24_15380 [Paracoccus sp. (in: a-proteobacteria)]|uniref:hypothetical protein n=1 Tax=Paracoccus sp. TaxID=267 RepID=UPI0026DF21C3|nr:hypothetical protein [Paracoccus sp. (in: a-proteobacteria)]MDO5622830.1 hypothetical protein [Paracoccus sp. (in: a-proteobacteria)]